MTAITIPASTVGGIFRELAGDEVVEPTVTWTAMECVREPLVAVTLTE